MNFQDYFQSYSNYFWQWEDDTEVLSIPNGGTIAYREQMVQTLQGLADNGLPPFGSLVLAFIATNNSLDDNVGLIEKHFTNFSISDRIVPHIDIEGYRDSFAFLRRLHQLPVSYKSGKRRMILLQTIFANSHRKINSKTAKGLAERFAHKDFYKKKLPPQKSFEYSIFYKEFKVIGLLDRQFPTAQSIIDAMGDLPDLTDEDLPELITETASQETYKDFVEELIDRDETFQVGTLIKPIWAGFKVPVYNALSSEQPLGGFSDISNKGDFDKLLVSEFASDDLVFMSRLANNEALYLHREMPPVADDLQRILLVDISLKMWGTPKALAHAVYLAIAKHPKSSGQSEVFVVGDDYQPVSYAHIDHIIDGLQKVDVGLHAGKGLQSFFEVYHKNKQLEVFYITTAEALKYPAIQKQMADHSAAFKYIITADQYGEISFFRNRNNARKLLQTIRLPLERLWRKPIKQRQVVAREPYTEYTNLGYPLLFSISSDFQKVMPLNDDIYCISDKCLFKRTMIENKKSSKGWELVLKELPANGLFEIGKMKDGTIQLLAYNPSSKEAKITSLDTNETGTLTFRKWSSKPFPEFLFQRDVFLQLQGKTGGVYLKLREGKIMEEQFQYWEDNVTNYNKRVLEVNNASVSTSMRSVLKNIGDVCIGKTGNLIVSSHELHINNQEQFYMSSRGAHVSIVSAKRIGNNHEFHFHDGSVVKMDVTGMLSLTSSNSAIPVVYLPSVVNAVIAMATSKAFAGNLYYLNEKSSYVKVYLESTGSETIMATKIIKENMIIGLGDARHIVLQAPTIISEGMNFDQAEKMKTALEATGAVVTIQKPEGFQLQKIISVPQFQKKYLQPFIDHIINHAATN
ncbi:MAG: ribosomal protein L7/L12 [Bacteroidota bacterium]